MSINLTEKAAYTAMYAFLVKVYERTQSKSSTAKFQRSLTSHQFS
ncbi:MAG: hypothetical protein V7L05_07150 [Nostoc sp.]